MKIRITGLPKTKMKYGGQSGYGFDLGQRNTYSKMRDNPYESSSSTLQPVPRKHANIEAEKDEVVMGDIDQDGQRETMVIGGKRHSEGGTPLNVPQGSFIFSDTKKMRVKDPEILKFFGFSPRKEGYTPAEIAKKYNITKYKAILANPLADSVTKRTAEIMIGSYEKMLGYLALVQEGMKGFPQGVPEVASSAIKGRKESGAQNRVQAPLVNVAEEQQESPEQQNPEEEQQEQEMAPPEQQGMEEQGMEEQPPMMYGGYYDFGGSYIPEYGVYAYGGDVPMAAYGYEMEEDVDDPGKKKKYKIKNNREVEAEYVPKVPAGYNPYEGVPNLYWKTTPGAGTPGSWGKGKPISGRHRGHDGGPCDNLTGTEEDMKARPDCYKSFLKKAGWENASPEERQKAWKIWWHSNERPTWIPGTKAPDVEDYVYTEEESTTEKPKERWVCNPSGEGVMILDPYTPYDNTATVYGSKEEAEKYCKGKEKPPGLKYICDPTTGKAVPVSEDKIQENLTYYESAEEAEKNCGTPNVIPPRGAIPFFGSQFAIGPKRYHAYASPLQQYIPNPAFLDPAQELAANAGIATTISRGYSGRPSQYSAATTGAQMKAMDNVANIIGRTANANVQIANQFSPLQTNIMNTLMQYQADRLDKLDYNENMYDKEYRNTARKYLADWDKFQKGTYDYMTKRNLFNFTNPTYAIYDVPNPWSGGYAAMKPGVNAYSQITGGTGAASNNTFSQYMQDFDKLKRDGYQPQEIKMILDRKYPTTSSKGSSAISDYSQLFSGNDDDNS